MSSQANTKLQTTPAASTAAWIPRFLDWKLFCASKFSATLSSPLVTNAEQPLQQKAQTYQQQAVGEISQAIALWKRAAAISPTDSTLQRAIYRDALATRDYATAYAAVQKVLALEPTAPDRKQLETLAKQLKPLASVNTSTSTPGSTTP